MTLTNAEFSFLGLYVEGFLFGFYSGIFAIHWHCHISKEETHKFNVRRNIIFYALWVLYVLSAAVIFLDIATYVISHHLSDDISMVYRLGYIFQPTIFACCDVIGQSILIHRCWIVWGRNIRAVIIPSILTFAYLVMWLASIPAQFIAPSHVGINETLWGDDLILTSLTASMTVNALVTGLIVLRIFKVFCEVKSNTTSDDKALGITHGGKLRAVVFIIIESGMTLFAIQLARLTFSIPLTLTDTEAGIFSITACIHDMLNGITPTIILVRVSMGLSFYNELSLVETVGSLRFAAAGEDPNPNAEIGSISQQSSYSASDDPIPIPGTGEEWRDDDIGENDEIQMVYQ